MSACAPVRSRRSTRSDRAGRIANFFEHGDSALCLTRDLEPAIRDALEDVVAQEQLRAQMIFDLDDLRLDELLQSVYSPVARSFLEDDIASIVRDLGEALGQKSLQGSLEVVTTNACTKLHSDFVNVRMICTYVGPGTEWVKNEDVVRENLRRSDVSVEVANRSVLRAPDVVNQCGPGDILFLKGEMFEGNRGTGAVHRSPPVTEQGLRRLVLRVENLRRDRME